MPVPLLPGPLGQIGNSSFSFYPPILGASRNEWKYRRATWSEFVVVNTQSGEEACIPRNFIGDVSFNGPTIIVGLRRELEWRDGIAVPYRRPVVEMPIAEMPIAVNDRQAARPRPPAPVVSIRLESPAPTHRGRKAMVLVMLGVVAAAIAADIMRPGFTSVRTSRTAQQKRSAAAQSHPASR